MSSRELIRPLIEGFVKITDTDTGEVLVDKKNAVHYENMSEAIALSLANRAAGHVHEMVFGNGASTVSGTGAITYFPPNVTGQDAALYNQTYSKVVNDLSPLNTDNTQNTIRVQHTQSQVFSDIVVTCVLGYTEPDGQEFFDDGTDNDGSYVFDELGLKSFDPSPQGGKLLTHVIFHPVQKTLNRSITIKYVLRIYMT